MKKVISFSLWGDDKLYCQGAIDNIAAARIHYPGWICRFYVNEQCPALPVLQKLDCETVIAGENAFYNTIDRTQDPSVWHNDYSNTGMLWRFFAIDDPEVDTVIFRDCDSRVGARDAHAVQEWINSYYVMHRMHECQAHWNAQVMGGMWGIHTHMLRGYVTDSIYKYIRDYNRIRNEPWMFIDLWWIMDCLWPGMKQFCIGHGYGHPHKFPIDGPMVGSVVHEEWRGQKYVP